MCQEKAETEFKVREGKASRIVRGFCSSLRMETGSIRLIYSGVR